MNSPKIEIPSLEKMKKKLTINTTNKRNKRVKKSPRKQKKIRFSQRENTCINSDSKKEENCKKEIHKTPTLIH